MKRIELPEETKKEYVKKLYECFTDGKEFEIFLNYFLQKLGFEEVVRTKYVGDKGIDLTCIKKGIDTSGIDTINYYVQAKRYAPTNKVQAKEVRDLKGTRKYDRNGRLLSGNYINMLITTSDFTRAALEEVADDINNPTILINGTQLLDLCIDHEIGFLFQPVFMKNEIAQILTQTDENDRDSQVTATPRGSEYLVERIITANDIRARILIVPQLIKNYIEPFSPSLKIIINGSKYTLNLDKTGRYLGGITNIYKACGLIRDDEAFIEKKAKWFIKDNVINVIIE